MFRYYANPRFLPIMLFGFLSALPIPLTGSVLTAWLADAHITKVLIGLVALFECPFALKPLFWPVINRVSLPFLTHWLGRRRSWALVSLVGLALSLMLAAFVSPDSHLLMFYFCIGLASVFSGCVYLIGIAYEIESLVPDQYAGGSACVIFGYRLGLVSAGAGALYLAHYFSWPIAYLTISLFIVMGAFVLMIASEPSYTLAAPALPKALLGGTRWKKTLSFIVEDVLTPGLELFQKKEWFWMLLFILFFRVADNFVEGMITPFYIEVGFTKAQIASVAKVYGMAATIAGSLVGGLVVAAAGLQRSLFLLGVLHAGRFLFCLSLFWSGPNFSFFLVTEVFSHFSSGMMMTTFIAALWKLTTPGKAAPQYALLWSAISLKGKLMAFLGGIFAHMLSWDVFFGIAFCMALAASVLPLALVALQESTPQITRKPI